jgi:hypothetical protein
MNLWLLLLGLASAIVFPYQATAQGCGAWGDVTQWVGSYTLTGKGTAPTPIIYNSITIDQKATSGQITLRRTTASCDSSVQWTNSVPDVGTGSVNDVGVEMEPDIVCTATLTGSGGFTSASGKASLLVDVKSGTLTFSASPTLDVTATEKDQCSSGMTVTQPFPSVPLGPYGYAGRDPAWPKFPLPTSPQALNQSMTFQATGYFGEVVPWTLTLNLTPVELEVVIDPQDYTTWRPDAGTDSSVPGPQPITINAKLQDKSGKPVNMKAQKFVFQLANVSHEPSVALNWLVGDTSDASPDLQLVSSENPTLTISGIQDEHAETPSGSYTESSVVVSSFDWGAWGEIQVTAVLPDGTQIQGHLIGDTGQTSVRLPKRSADSHIADSWKDAHDASSLSDDDDSETDPVGMPGCVGDGLTLYEEYRGWIENGKHIDGDPHLKDFFILNLIGADAEPGIWLFTDVTGLAVHKDFLRDELFPPDVPVSSPLINANHAAGAHVVDQHGVAIVTCNIDGGKTNLKQAGVRGRPGLTFGICMQDRSQGGSLTNPYALGGADQLLAYDQAVAHELSHSVGLEHHGEGNPEGRAFFNLLIPPNAIGPVKLQLQVAEPNLFAGTPSVYRDIQLLFEDGSNAAVVDTSQLQALITACSAVSTSPSSSVPNSMQQVCQGVATYLQNGFAIPLVFYVGAPRGQHSGNDQCLMRYHFSQAYPQAGQDPAEANVYYLVAPGSEPLGVSLCDSALGTGINGPGHRPQPRYFDAAPGLGSCQSWVCVNDKYAPVTSPLKPETIGPRRRR